MMKKMTRRELAGAVLAATAAAQIPPQPAPPAPAGPADELQAARQQNRRNGEALAKASLPVETEPAFHFTV